MGQRRTTSSHASGNEAKKHLRGRINDSAFQFWFDRTVPLGLDDGAFVIGVPNDFAREWIEKRLARQVGEALEEVLGDIRRGQGRRRRKGGRAARKAA